MFARKLYATPPMSSFLNETHPNFEALPENATEQQYRNFFNALGAAVWHGVGTAAMMNKKFGGVVDANIVVYGVRNLRVVNASAVPFEVNGHPTSVIYAMAEKATDLIQGKYKGV